MDFTIKWIELEYIPFDDDIKIDIQMVLVGEIDTWNIDAADAMLLITIDGCFYNIWVLSD